MEGIIPNSGCSWIIRFIYTNPFLPLFTQKKRWRNLSVLQKISCKMNMICFIFARLKNQTLSADFVWTYGKTLFSVRKGRWNCSDWIPVVVRQRIFSRRLSNIWRLLQTIIIHFIRTNRHWNFMFSLLVYKAKSWSLDKKDPNKTDLELFSLLEQGCT